MALVILFLPLLGALFSGFFHSIVGEKLAKLFATVCMLFSMVFSWFILMKYVVLLR